jgi:hypothetical protein
VGVMCEPRATYFALTGVVGDDLQLVVKMPGRGVVRGRGL